ncbi:hypothetical protein BHS04_32065 [Myxococcus xanthus]|nr:hypothetical protein BHS04_32065 [Myxococcus xanthus]
MAESARFQPLREEPLMSKSLSRRIQALPLLAAMFAASTAMAERAETGREYVFTTVDSYTVQLEGTIEITGVLQGEASPRTLTFSAPNNTQNSAVAYRDRCDRLALLAMTKPGAYLFTTSSGGSISYHQFACKLTRVP